MSELLFTIGEVAELLGVTAKAIRHYHKIGVLDKPIRDANNYRLYQMKHLEQIQQILQLKRFGLSLRQIKLIFEADAPDILIRTVLQEHEKKLQNEIRQLQHHLHDTQHFLKSDTNPLEAGQNSSTDYSAMTILSDVIKPHSNGLSDMLREFEQGALDKIDRYEWADGYDIFWYESGKYFINTMQAYESLLIFWIERYLALEQMDIDDLQAKQWLEELNNSPAKKMIAQSFAPPVAPEFPEKDQEYILKLLPSLLYQQGSELQRLFLGILINT